ncbi:MAG TPA: GGDEF domain-containing protein [Thermoanaerobaculia bacterium]|jgi:diguanylate cyclase (GGDEF)-like protein|nr:GGDEF domain-containing protein [Thermoanaerobaculia bacterium]
MAEETALRTLESTGALSAIERERFHSYSQLVRNLHWLAAALVVLYGLLAHGVKLSAVLAGHVRLGSDLGTLLVLAAAMVLYTLALHSRFFARFTVEERMWAENGIDLSWITAVVLFTGATVSPFFFLYYIVLYASTPTTGRRQTYGKAVAITILVLGIILPLGAGIPGGNGAASPSWDVLSLVGNLVWPLAGVWLVAYFSAEAGTLGASLHQSLFLAAHTDALTGLPNLRYFTIAADLRGKLGGFYTIVMVDADHLKQVNDTHGHAIGSDLIRTVADAIRSAARSGDDLCSRIGGDEFIVRLASASEAGALAYCRRVRTYLGEHPLHLDATTVLPISVSMGVAAFPKHGKSLSEVTSRADQALYRSKQEGRSRDRVWAA